jgi:hypothetical protein
MNWVAVAVPPQRDARDMAETPRTYFKAGNARKSTRVSMPPFTDSSCRTVQVSNPASNRNFNFDKEKEWK